MLVVEHDAQCPPGWMGEWLAEAGVELDVRRAYAGDPIPSDLTGHSAMVVLGGPMDAYSDEAYPWLREVKDLVRQAVAGATPTLGICLGHQLITVALGGQVRRNPKGQQIGLTEVGWMPEAADDQLFAPLSTARVAVQWNNDIATELPERSVVLARTPRGEVQAARFGPAMWGVQWHPEAGAEIVRAWADGDRDEARERGVDVDEYVAEVAAAREELRASWRELGTGFAELTREPARSW
jgi:GMP synthase (glutamine-hydrolysing)